MNHIAIPRWLLAGAVSLLLAPAVTAQHRWSVRQPRTVPPNFLWGHVSDFAWSALEVLVFNGFDQGVWSWNGYRWTSHATLTTGLTFPSGAADPWLGELHLTGGPTAAATVSSEHWTYNAASGVTTQLGLAPWPPRVGHAVSAANNPAFTWSNILLLGGNDGGANYYSDCWTYDSLAGFWTPAASGPSARSNHVMAFDGSQFVYAFGGFDGTSVLGDFWRFDSTGGTWSQIAAAGPGPRQNAGMTFDVARNRLVLGGGMNLTTPFQDTWEYDPARNAWTQVANLPYAITHQQFSWLPFRGTVEAISPVGHIIPFAYEPVPPATPQAASIGLYRSGCNTGGDPFLMTDTIPVVNTTYTIDVYAWGPPVILTFDSQLGPQDPNDCSLHTGTAVTIPITIVNNFGTFSLTVPNTPTLIGKEFYQQAVSVHPTLPRLAFSNTLRLTVGTF